jgi:hypothetical protein
MILQRKKHVRLRAIAVLTLAVSGCVVQSGQFSTLVGLFKNDALDLSDNSWSVTYGDYQALVYAVTVPEGTLFTNQVGDQVMFDGWSIRQVSGMGRGRIALGINDNQSDRQYRRGNRLVAVHQCQQWQRQVNSGLTSFAQTCFDKSTGRGAFNHGFQSAFEEDLTDGNGNNKFRDSHVSSNNSYSNSILVLEDGSISIIRQIVDERYTPLTLTKLK